MKTIRIERHLDSDTLHLPELLELIGKDVEITVREAAGNGKAGGGKPTAPDEDAFPLRGTVLRDDDPFAPAVPPEDWDALQ